MPIFTRVVDITVLQGTKMQMVQSFLVNLQREDTHSQARGPILALLLILTILLSTHFSPFPKTLLFYLYYERSCKEFNEHATYKYITTFYIRLCR